MIVAAKLDVDIYGSKNNHVCDISTQKDIVISPKFTTEYVRSYSIYGYVVFPYLTLKGLQTTFNACQ